MNAFRLIQSDYTKYKKYGGSFITIVFFTQGFWASFQYRLAHAVYRLKIPVLKQLLQLNCMIWQKVIEITTGISIPASAQIGSSFYIGHFGGIIINSNTVMGSNCNISQGVTIGVSGTDERRGVPQIGNNVYIGANTIGAGKIIIGNDVLIGAASLMVKDASDNSVWVGVPAVKVSDYGSKGYV